MALPDAHPDPPHDLSARNPVVRQTVGPWIRFHDARHSALHFSRGGTSRFNDPDSEFGVLYTADDFAGAFIETFGRKLDVRSVTVGELASTGVARIEATRPLTLIDLASTGGLARLSADARLMAGDPARARVWSRALWSHPAGADGLYYRLRHDSAQCGCALFDRCRRRLRVTSLGRVWDPVHQPQLIAALDTYAFGLIIE